jgi:hypothetical protein
MNDSRCTRIFALAASLILAIGVFAPAKCAAQGADQRPTELFNGKEVVPNEVLVKFKAALAEKRGEMTSDDRLQSESRSIAEIEESFQTEHLRRVGGAGWYLVHSLSLNTNALMEGISARADVALVEPNHVVKPLTNSVAQYYAPYQWALNNTGQAINGPTGINTGTPNAHISASQAWNLTTGFKNYVIATIDLSGIDYTHPDLSPNIWSAPSSYVVNLGSGSYTCPAGSHGFQSVNPPGIQGPCDPKELYGDSHGTMIAGIMGANGASTIGVSGINWSTSIIHVNTGPSDASVADAIQFLIQTKAHFGALANIAVVNNSYQLADASTAVEDEILAAPDMLFVAAAGNGGVSNDPPGGVYPANFGSSPLNLSNVVAVANTDNNDNLCHTLCINVVANVDVPSDWGAESVHLGAPGWAIASTVVGGGYNVTTLNQSSTGTSFAAPYVTGTGALVLSRCAGLSTVQLKNILLENVDYITGLYGCTAPNGQSNYCTITQGTAPSGQLGGGRLNAYKAVSACGYLLSVTKTGVGSGTVTSSTSGTVSGNLTPINCGSVCSAVFTSSAYGGSSVTLTATPATGSVFTSWSGACSGTGACTVTMNNARSVSATFTLLPETLTVGVSGSGTVTSSPTGISCPGSCSAVFSYGTTVTLSASPASGYLFSGWSGACSGTGVCAITMNNATSVSATFTVASVAFTLTGPMNVPRENHTATLLPNGLVLIAGGSGPAGRTGHGTVYASAELYDASTGTFTYTGNMNRARFDHTATLLQSGLVLIAGGSQSIGEFAYAELYNPTTGTSTPTGSMIVARRGHQATLLPNGLVLISGGAGGGGSLASAEVYNPSTGAFTLTGSMNTARSGHRATLLSNGRVLVTAGEDYVTGGSGTILASAELYNPSTGAFTSTGSMSAARLSHTATLLPSGSVLIAGGQNTGSFLAGAELYSPSTGAFTLTGSMSVARVYHTATLLLSGLVLVAGGDNNGTLLASAELYDASTGTFTDTANMNAARWLDTATLLLNGSVLVAGGATTNIGILASAEIYP